MDRFMAASLVDPVEIAVQNLLRQGRYKAFICCAGGGSQAYDWIARVPGASEFLAGATFPYATDETDRFLGFRTDHYVSRENALDLAAASYLRAAEHLQRQCGDGSVAKKPMGIGLTAAIATTRQLRGGCRVHVAAVTPENVVYAYEDLESGVGESMRHQHSAETSIMALDIMLATAGFVPIGNLKTRAIEDQELRNRFFQHPWFAPFDRRSAMDYRAVRHAILLPGSFNPMHDGHRDMARVIEELTGKQVIYTTTADSVHKPPLGITELLNRAAQIRLEQWAGNSRSILFTHGDPLFVDKARNFPGVNFAVGVDTVARMLEPKWYSDAEAGVRSMLGELHQYGAHLFVFGRAIGGRFTVLSDIDVPDAYGHLFSPVPGRWDLSSTAIREQRSHGVGPGYHSV